MFFLDRVVPFQDAGKLRRVLPGKRFGIRQRRPRRFVRLGVRALTRRVPAAREHEEMQEEASDREQESGRSRLDPPDPAVAADLAGEASRAVRWVLPGFRPRTFRVHGRLARDHQVKVLDQVSRGTVPLIPVLRQHLQDDVVASLRNIGTADDGRNRLFVQVFQHREQRRVAAERHGPGDHVVEGHAERVDVAARVERPHSHGLFGRHVVRRPEGHTRLGNGVVVDIAG